MDGANVTFLFQFGLLRDTVSIEASALTLKTLKEYACNFIITKCPDHGLNQLFERLLLFKHDYNSSNVLQLIKNAAEIVDETLIEIVLKTQVPTEEIIVRPHTLSVHSYKTPTFCNFCGEMLFGLVKQGLKCEGCGMNYHKRCVVKIPNNCIQDSNKQRRSSTMLNVPRSPSQGSTSSFGGACDDNQNMGAFNLSQNNTSSVTTSKQSNSSSLGDKIPWTDREMISRIKIPHTFVVHSYTRPTICGYCKKLLRGLFKQGLQCKDCHYNIHKKCIDKIPKDCIGENSKDNCGGTECSDSDPGDHEGKFDEGKEDGDMDSDVESSPNSSQHESYQLLNEHQVGEILNQQLKISDEPLPNSCQPNSSDNNIPFMRIVQSVKHTKKCGAKILKEGWMIHYTSRDSALRRHYWRLDSKAITLFQSDTGSKYYKEIPLVEILGIETFDSSESSKKTYSFKLRTALVDYYVGEDSLYFYLAGSLPTLDSDKYSAPLITLNKESSHNRLIMDYASRSKLTMNQLAANLFELMGKKKTNL
ncbi:serine/threonine-protein kinase D3-like [Chelonus insularis]|uniref:serine/threonine-protein kinase D3-like n=2 Tax=Chelonus insularis TaxID=460826 RepID=UPI00158EE68C|nr:serine/threonine-protein kinase D3-like [Chelonus insularis]